LEEHREQTEGVCYGATRYKIVAGGKRKNSSGEKFERTLGESSGRK
jgi:hypothetical protein